MYLDQGQARQRLGMVRLKYSRGGGGSSFFAQFCIMQREKGDFQTGMTAGLKVSGTVEGRRSRYLLKYQWCIAHCNFLCRTKKGEMTTCLPRIICTDVKLRPGGQN